MKPPMKPPKKPKKGKKPCAKPALLEYLDRAICFYEHLRWGREALPVFDEDLPVVKHFDNEVVFVSGDHGGIVPVLPGGFHVPIVDC